MSLFVARITYKEPSSSVYNSINIKDVSEELVNKKVDATLRQLKRDGYKVVDVEKATYSKI